MSEAPIFDNWSWAGHKRAMGDTKLPGKTWEAPTWVPEDDARRLRAYTIYEGYYTNSARHFLPTLDEKERSKHREYGDAALIVHQIVAALIGDDQSIVVEGADAFDPDFDPDAIPEPGEDLDEEERDAEMVAFQEEAEFQAEARRAAELQDRLQTWAQEERFTRKLAEVERDAVKLGDGVLFVTWSNKKDRPRIRIYDPGTYFPVLTDADEDYPSRVHLAWEIPPKLGEDNKLRVRRMTFSLGPIGAPPLAEDGLPTLDTTLEERLEADGTRTRKYPWNIDRSNITCYMTDATFTLDGAATINDFSEARASYATNEDGEVLNNFDLEIDFIPIVHIPNTVAEKEHFGRSSLATVLQVLDDLQNADTDLEGAAATSGTPAVAITKPVNVKDEFVVGPGRTYILGEGGRMDVLDSSGALDALLKYLETMLKRLSVNARIPEAVLGRIDPGEVPSGIALALAMSPLQTMVGEMRLTRDEKLPLILKMVMRYMQRNGDLPPGADQILPAAVEYGSFLPSDRAAAAGLVEQLLRAKAISRLTSVQMLVEAGFPIEDAAAEVERIQQEDFDGAVTLLEVTGNEEVVSDYLGADVRPASQPDTTLPPPELPELPELGAPAGPGATS